MSWIREGMEQTVQSPAVGHGNAFVRTESRPDVLVVGAGVFGLWAARQAILAGKRTLVLDKRRAGAGASGGFVGALMPHMPDRWNDKKQFQLDALISLEPAVKLLEQETGIDCGYRRCGRLMPLGHERMTEVVAARMAGATAHWGSFQLRHWADLRGTPAQGWISPDLAAFGAQWDDLSARIAPRSLIAALAAHVRARGKLVEGCAVTGLADGEVILSDGTRIAAGEIIIANGWEAYGLLEPHWKGADGVRLGRGVKGQAMLLGHCAPERPIVYADGAYVVPHADGNCAVGASTVENWQTGAHGEPDAFDPADNGFLARACNLVPALRDAPVLDRWAGVRPRNMLRPHDTELHCGPVPGLERVKARIGGFKTGLACAHALN